MSERQLAGKNRIVTFVLPFGGVTPIGGFKIVYEYANRLSGRGWHVRVAHPVFSEGPTEIVSTPIVARMRQRLGYHWRRIRNDYRDYRPDSWFNVSPDVELIYPETAESRHLPRSDVWIATAWQTAKWAEHYEGAHLYLIQSLETWGGPEEAVMSTWKLPFKKVVIARWLEDVGHSLGEPTTYIPNGLDFQTFGMDICPADRDPGTVAMLYHEMALKGSADGLLALQIAKRKMPALKATLFGVFDPPVELPRWIEYQRHPPQRRLRGLYNKAAIFLSPSWAEGWPLPPAEALQCGAALVATDIGGHREYAHHGETALLSPPKAPQALAENIIRLLEDRELRLKLAYQGHRHIQQFTWDRAVTSFESVLHESLGMPQRDSGEAHQSLSTAHNAEPCVSRKSCIRG
jgi:glycosyltransferase involved in cell wall biosynthesis